MAISDFIRTLSDFFGRRSRSQEPFDRHPTHEAASEPDEQDTSSSVRIVTDPGDTAGNMGWHHAGVAAWQDAAYQDLLASMYAGDIRLDLRVAADAVQSTGLQKPTLLEIGCGSGYYSEVFSFLNAGSVRYTGLDYSQTMIDLAKKKYPDTPFVLGDATDLEIPDAAFDIVFNGAALMHIPDYSKAIAESRRVARSWCIFHTVPLLNNRRTTMLTKKAYGGDVVEVVQNRDTFEALLAQSGLNIANVFESIPHAYLDEVVGERVVAFTYLCKVPQSE